MRVGLWISQVYISLKVEFLMEHIQMLISFSVCE